MRGKLFVSMVIILFLLIFNMSGDILFSQEKVIDKKKKENKNKENKNKVKGDDEIAAKMKKDKKLQLNVNKVIEYLLSNNHDVKKALLEYKESSLGIMANKAKYDVNIYGNLGLSRSNNYNDFLSDDQTVNAKNYAAGIVKNFNTGTTLQAGIMGMHRKSNEGGFDLGKGFFLATGGDVYQTQIKAELAQELLKNSFGVTDRMTEQKISYMSEMGKRGVRMKLAGLLVDAITNYWMVAVAEENLKTSEINLKSTTDIRNQIANKMELGLSEREDILDWSGKVLQSKNNNETAKKNLFDAKLAVKRVLNLDPGTDIEIGTTFTKEPPKVTYEQAIKDALIKRADWNIQQIALKNAELEYKIAYNELLPSLKLKLGVGNNVYKADNIYLDNNYLKTIKPGMNEYSVGLEFLYPLGNTAGEVRMRNARLGMQKQHVSLDGLEKQIKDEIASIVKQCEVSFTIYQQTKKGREFAQEYYNQVFTKFKRGRYSSLHLKFALDGYIGARQAELMALVEYNVALIRRDFARNVIFENLGIDIDSILKNIED